MPCVPTGDLNEQLQDARVAFVGTVVRTEGVPPETTVAVESVWLGPRLPENVVVRAGPAPERRTFIEGRRYLFVPKDGSPPFVDDGCTATQPYTPAVAKLAPEGTLSPQGEGPSLWILVVVVLLGLAYWQARRARRRAEEIDV